MPTVRDILIRSIDCIETSGFVSKNDALYNPRLGPPTAKLIEDSFNCRPENKREIIDAYGATADSVIDWVMSCKSGNVNDYILACKEAVKRDSSPRPEYGIVCSIYPAYKRHLVELTGMDKVTEPNRFVADPGVKISGLTVEVIKISNKMTYDKIWTVDPLGRLLTFTINHGSKKTPMLTRFNLGDKISVSGTVYKNKFSTPFETTLSRPTFI